VHNPYHAIIYVVVLVSLGVMIFWPTLFMEQALNNNFAKTGIIIYPHAITLNDYLQRYKDFQFGFLTFMGGVIGVLTLLLSLKRFEQTQTEHRNIRFKDAIELLGNDEMDVRLGAIYSLEQLMKEKPDQFAVRVVNILAAYVRHRGTTGSYNHYSLISNDKDPEPWENIDLISQNNNLDIAAALVAIAARCELNLSDELKRQINFTFPEVDFKLFDIKPYNLCVVYSGERHNENIHSWSSVFAGKNFHNANLRGLSFFEKDLSHANFVNANLAWVNFNDAILNNVNLGWSDLTNAQMDELNIFEKRAISAHGHSGEMRKFSYLELSDLIDNPKWQPYLPYWNEHTIWPDGQRRDQQGHVIVDPTPTPPAETPDNTDTPQAYSDGGLSMVAT
jgi:hypothetical protein